MEIELNCDSDLIIGGKVFLLKEEIEKILEHFPDYDYSEISYDEDYFEIYFSQNNKFVAGLNSNFLDIEVIVSDRLDPDLTITTKLNQMFF